MALEFDGATQYIQVAQTKDLPIYNETTYSVCGWVKAPAQDDKRIFAEGSSASNNPLLTIGSGRTTDSTTNKLQVYIRNDAGTALLGAYGTKSTTTVFDDTWHHFCWNDNNGTAELYIDSVKDATNFNYTRSGTLTLNRTGIAAVIRAEVSHWLNGELFDIRCYNRCLTANEIAEIYHHRGADKVWQGLVGRWRLDEKTSGTLAEHTDVAPHNMTSNNSPSPYVASADNEFEGKAAYRAFDGTASIWGSNGTSGWLKLDYGSGNAPVLIGYSIRSYGDTKYQNVMPKNWTFKGSNNDTDWTTLDTRTNVTGWTASAWKEFWFSNSTGYRYYMIDITANNGYSLCTYIAEMKHFTSQYNVVDLSGNGNHGTPYNSPTYQASPHRLRRGVLVS
jgi:hypothetical protein